MGTIPKHLGLLALLVASVACRPSADCADTGPDSTGSHDSGDPETGETGHPETGDTANPETGDTGDTEKPEPDVLEWITIEGGNYWMGCHGEDCDYKEVPLHEVIVPSFEMGRSEATVAEYRSCVDEGECEAPEDTSSFCNWQYDDREDHPINCISWFQAGDFCEWAGGRLLSESEWEYAARNRGQPVVYPWGDDEPTCDLAVIDEPTIGCGMASTWPVCSKPAGDTEQGACDMSGNVYEWTQDWLHWSYAITEDGVDYLAPSDGSAWEVPEGIFRMMRGGGIGSTSDGFRARSRVYHEPEWDYGGLGVRCGRG